MTDEAERAFQKLAAQYVALGFPALHDEGFRPDDADEQKAYQELSDEGLLKPRTVAAWQLTQEGLDAIVDRLGPMTEEVEQALGDIIKEYVGQNCPDLCDIGFRPDAGEEKAYKELSARGYLEPHTAAAWRLTEKALAWVLYDR